LCGFCQHLVLLLQLSIALVNLLLKQDPLYTSGTWTAYSWFICLKDRTASTMWPLEFGRTEMLISTVEAHRVCHLPLSWSEILLRVLHFLGAAKPSLTMVELLTERQDHDFKHSFEFRYWICVLHTCAAGTSSKQTVSFCVFGNLVVGPS